MKRYFLQLCYDGTNYCGWQVQANVPTVQETINKGLEKLLGHHIASMGCGRTDTGVHAKDFYMHFETEKEELPDRFLYKLNCVLPDDISIFRVIPVHDKAHSRFDATERTYEYYLHFIKDPFLKKYSFYQGFYQIDWDKVFEATDFLNSITDFTALCLPSEDFKTNICQVRNAHWQQVPSTSYGVALRNEYQLKFTITSNRFLRGMIRKIVGTVLMVGKGKMDMNHFKETVAEKKDFKINHLAPPTGLFLSNIKYPYIPEVPVHTTAFPTLLNM